jgi:hypothetical protein
MPAFPKFDLTRTNHYPGDFTNRLAGTFNNHDHTPAAPANFLAYDLALTSTIGFFGDGVVSDPFGAVGAQTPLAIVEILPDAVIVNKLASATVLGTLNYSNTGQVTAIGNVKTTLNSSLIEFAKYETGTIAADDLADLLTNSLIVESSFLPDSNLVLPTFSTPETIYLDLDPTNSYIQVVGQPQLNPTLSLIRGKKYLFNLTPAITANSHFNITRSVRDPNTGLDRYPIGIITDANLNLEFLVGYDTPATLYYQSSSNSYIYGQLKILSGFVDPAIPLVTAAQALSEDIPATPPTNKAYLKLNNSKDYRVLSWTLIPKWLSGVIGSAFIQLQMEYAGITYSLSELVSLQAATKVSINPKSVVSIPAAATVYCAIYANQNLVGLVQQLNTIDVRNT